MRVARQWLLLLAISFLMGGNVNAELPKHGDIVAIKCEDNGKYWQLGGVENDPWITASADSSADQAAQFKIIKGVFEGQEYYALQSLANGNNIMAVPGSASPAWVLQAANKNFLQWELWEITEDANNPGKYLFRAAYQDIWGEDTGYVNLRSDSGLLRVHDDGETGSWQNATIDFASPHTFEIIEEHQPEPLHYNKVISVLAANFDDKPLWTHPSYRLGGDKYELLASVDGTEREANGNQFFFIRSKDYPEMTRPIEYGDEVQILSLHTYDPGAGDAPKSLNPPYVWWANRDSRHGEQNYEVVISRQNEVPEGADVFIIKSPYGLTGEVDQKDFIWLHSKHLDDERVWIHPDSRWGNAYFEILIKDFWGQQGGGDRSFSYGLFDAKHVKRDELIPAAQEAYDNILAANILEMEINEPVGFDKEEGNVLRATVGSKDNEIEAWALDVDGKLYRYQAGSMAANPWLEQEVRLLAPAAVALEPDPAAPDQPKLKKEEEDEEVAVEKAIEKQEKAKAKEKRKGKKKKKMRKGKKKKKNKKASKKGRKKKKKKAGKKAKKAKKKLKKKGKKLKKKGKRKRKKKKKTA